MYIKKVNKMNKKKLIGIIVLIALVITVILIIINISNPSVEEKYKSNPTDENLVELAIYAVNENDREMMEMYLPIAVEVDDFIEIAESNDWNVENEKYEIDAEKTYEIVLVHYILSYIYKEDYYGFHEAFPEFYKDLMNIHNNSYWSTAVLNEPGITNEGYENIIKALKNCEPERPEFVSKNEELIHEYGSNLIMQMDVYIAMRDNDNMLKVSERFQEVLDFYRENE